MKSKEKQKIRDKGVVELGKEAQKLREEIAKLQLDMKINPPKDINIVAKKKKTLAFVLTLISEKQSQS